MRRDLPNKPACPSTKGGHGLVRSVQLAESSQGPRFVEAEAPTPSAGPGAVLVQVCAAGITPSELLWYPTTYNKDGTRRTHAIPGHEFSGVITAIGPGVSAFAVGDEVYGMNDWFADGTIAEFCVAGTAGIAPKPKHLSHAESAAVPIGALTAWQGLVDRAKVLQGERVLVHGGAGAVGVFVIQIARLRGAEVIATASSRNAEFVAKLGAQAAIDYAATPFEQHAKDVDIVFDCVGGDTLRRSWSVLKPGGRMVTIAAGSEAQDDPRVKEAFFIVEPNQKQLIQIAALLDAGTFRVFVDSEISLAEAPDAFARTIPRKLGFGKTVVVMQ
jgi:NADPH:quinone reductase-like Zn-dependent oxidoreductase